jgi:hypothetical protein
MDAEILRRVTNADLEETPEIDNTGGQWVTDQDPITGEVLNVWRHGDLGEDNPDTPVYEYTPNTISCLVRGIVDGGIRVAGTTERFGDTYENIDYAKMWVPARVRITKRDRITNIRAKRGGHVLWLDEEYVDGTRPTIFNVNVVTPLFDAFNHHTENFVLLEKAEN